MFAGNSVLAVVPARGGSKGIPRKNLVRIGGLSLVARVGQLIANIEEIDIGVVSTDDEEIAEEARAHGLAAPFFRPEALAGDFVSDFDVVKHALEESEKSFGRRFEIVLMLQPTSPLRTAKEIRECLSAVSSSDVDSAWTVSPVDLKYHPDKQLIVENDGALSFSSDRGPSVIARQQLSQTYYRNGAVYAMKRSVLFESSILMGNKPVGVVSTLRHVSIDVPEDVEQVEEMLAQLKTLRSNAPDNRAV